MYCLTISPNSINMVLTKKNLNPRPKILAVKNGRKFILSKPLAKVKTLIGTGENAAKKTAYGPYFSYIFSTVPICSCLFLKIKLKTGLPPKRPRAYPKEPPKTENSALSGLARSIVINKISGGGAKKKLSTKALIARPVVPQL